MPKSELPIESIRSQLKQSVQTNRRFVLEAPTGSGKSTQVPQMLLDENLLGADGVVWMLQPRRNRCAYAGKTHLVGAGNSAWVRSGATRFVLTRYRAAKPVSCW